jgi:hypothetical protein
MPRLIKVAVALAIAGLILGYGLYGAKPKPAVKVRVSFEGLTNSNPPLTPADPEYYIQKFHNDALGPYIAANGITAQITGDLGDFVFEMPHHSGRSVLVIFPLATSQLGDYLPDTAGVYPEPVPDDPIDYFVMRTYNSFATKKLNFLAMTPGTSAEVHFWAWMCTESVHSYRVIYNQPDPDHDAGIVKVTAFDQNPQDGVVDRWEITPVSDTGDTAWITRWDRKMGWLYYGIHPMPFKLIVERL